jgi:hypothetical protein
VSQLGTILVTHARPTIFTVGSVQMKHFRTQVGLSNPAKLVDGNIKLWLENVLFLSMPPVAELDLFVGGRKFYIL